jgi:hypothetical protein
VVRYLFLQHFLYVLQSPAVDESAGKVLVLAFAETWLLFQLVVAFGAVVSHSVLGVNRGGDVLRTLSRVTVAGLVFKQLFLVAKLSVFFLFILFLFIEQYFYAEFPAVCLLRKPLVHGYVVVYLKLLASRIHFLDGGLVLALPAILLKLLQSAPVDIVGIQESLNAFVAETSLLVSLQVVIFWILQHERSLDSFVVLGLLAGFFFAR